MSEDYQSLLRKLYAFEERGMRLGLDGIREALKRRGHPERAFPSIIIGGSNGKGTSVALIERALRESGYRTGLFTSPHLHRFTERIRIDGEPISEDEAAALIEGILQESLKDELKDGQKDEQNESRTERAFAELSFFEAVTLMAFEAFRARGVEIAILEVGLGGRLDTTNAAEPLFSGVTNISLEHTAILGDTIEAIAREKAGIFRPSKPALIGDQGEARSILEGLARAAGSVPVFPSHEAPPTSLLGPHERANARFAFAAVDLLREHGFRLPERDVERAFLEARWPGRFELIRRAGDRPEFLFDAGHNPAACEALADELRSLPPREKNILIFGAMRDKDHRAMLAAFDGIVDERVYLRPPVARAEDPAVFEAFRRGHIAADPDRAYALALELAEKLKDETAGEARIIACGSIFVMAEIRRRALGIPADPPIAM